MHKEKEIEKAIIEYLISRKAIVESMQWGSIMVKRGPKSYRVNLQTDGCPDLMVLYFGRFIGIEVKKDQKEVDKWLKLEERYNNYEVLPKSYEREKQQIIYSQKIKQHWGEFLITHSVSEVMQLLNKKTLWDNL